MSTTVHDALAAVSASGPDRVALICPQGTISYRQLGRAATVVAAQLAERGVRAGDLVPVLLPRGPELVAALLGVLRLGAGYAALDLRWPDHRIRELCAALGAPVTVTAPAGRVAGEVWDPAGVFDEPEHTLEPAAVSTVAVSPDAVSTVFFTSGSTGRPHGVLSTHRAVTELFAPGRLPLRLGESTVLAQAAPVPWDVLTLELWGPLLRGGTSVLVDGHHLTPGQLRHHVARDGLNTLWLTGSLFNLFVEEDLDALRGLTRLAIGGERVSPRHVARCLREHPDIRLYNGYGPAENCVFSTMHRITPEDCGPGAEIPIGRPVGGTTVLVLDGDRPCRTGEVGEICLTGSRLARGYLGDPELTRQRFRTVELAGGPVRVYRSGDLGRSDAQGVFHFHGRLDRQVKVRGHRVEPGEIERAARDHPDVLECVTLPQADRAGNVTGLVLAYRPATGLAPGPLRAFLADRLPAYLVPDRCVATARLPRLDNGKLDVLAVRSATGPAPAEAGLLGTLAAITRDCTGLDRLAPDESLVEAGASSLELIRLGIRVSSRFGCRIAATDVIARPTLTRLAELVRAAGPATPAPDPGPDRTHRLTCTQSAFLITEQVDAANRSAWHCLLSWELAGPVDAEALRAAVTAVHRRQPALHARYLLAEAAASTHHPTEPEFHLLTAPIGPEAAARLAEVLHRPFDVTRGPVWRAALVRVGRGAEWRFGVAVHHVAFDGWSERVLAEDLSRAYRRLLPEGVLPEDVACRRMVPEEVLSWPFEPDTGADLAGQRRRLTDELAGVAASAFPRPARPITDARPARIVRELDRRQARRCEALAREHGTTPFVIGLAGYLAATARHTGQLDFPVAVPIVRRAPRDEDTIGCLLNVLCLRVRLPGPPNDRVQAIGVAKAAMGRAMAVQDVPFAESLALLAARADDPGRVFPPMFVLQDNLPPVLDLPGARAVLNRPQPWWSGFELLTELWLTGDTGGELSVTYRPAAVDSGFAEALAGSLLDFLGGRP